MRTIPSGIKVFDEVAIVGTSLDCAEHQLTLSVQNATQGHFLVSVRAVGTDVPEPIKDAGVPIQIDAVSPESLTGVRIVASNFIVTPVNLNAEATYTATVSSYAAY